MQQKPFTFIHSADLHLGAPFRGVGELFDADGARQEARQGASLMTEAAFTALRRLEALCLAEQAAFLVLAGDVYDEEDGILRARLELRDMFARLETAGVRVFLAHGNHDPLQTGRPAVRWPGNVTVFDAEAGSRIVERDGEVLAVVHGVSHSVRRETSNLAERFSRDQAGPVPPGVVHVGVLHCAVGGRSEGHAPYAPCTPADLARGGMDYWALGHVHTPRVLGENPCIVYPGSLQGLHVNESGPHGCVVARVSGAGRFEREFVPLAPVQWEKPALNLDGDALESVDELEEALLASLEREGERARSVSGAGFAPDRVICRLTVSGKTSLDQTLRRPGALDELARRLRRILAESGSRVWLSELVLRTAPALDAADLCARQGLTGEVARQAEAALRDVAALEALRDGALSDFYGNSRLRRVLAVPDATETAELVASARSLCCGLLEGE